MTDAPEHPAASGRRLPRFSLRSLVLFVLLAGSAYGAWMNWAPWRLDWKFSNEKIRYIGFSNDGRLLFLKIGKTSSTVVALDLEKRKLLYEYFDEQSFFGGAKPCPHNSDLIVSVRNDALRVIDARTGNVRRKILPAPGDRGTAPWGFQQGWYVPNTDLFLAYTHRLQKQGAEPYRARLVDLESGATVSTFKDGVYFGWPPPVIHADGTYAGAMIRWKRDPAYCVWDLRSGKLHRMLPLGFVGVEAPGRSWAVQFDRDKRTFTLVDVISGKPIRKLHLKIPLSAGPRYGFLGYFFRDDASRLVLRIWTTDPATSAHAHSLPPLLFNTETGEQLVSFARAAMAFRQWQFTPNGENLLVPAPRSAMEAHSLRTGKKLYELKELIWEADSMSYQARGPWSWKVASSPDGSRLAALRQSGELLLFDRGTGRRLNTGLGDLVGPEKSLALLFLPFDKNGDELATLSSGSLRLYRRHHPEWWWGAFYLKETWAALVLSLLFAWSLRRDSRGIRTIPSPDDK